VLIDITLLVTPEMIEKAHGNEQKSFSGHFGTHFDVMNKEFPLGFLIRKAVVFDVSGVLDRDISLHDVDLSLVQKDMFVAFSTGFIEKTGYGSKAYFSGHPQLSNELIGLRNAVQAALIVSQAAWENKVSRGCHYREN